jgi:hypothetical protein
LPDARQARVVGVLVRDTAIVAFVLATGRPAIGVHRAELVEHERLAVASDPALAEHDRPAEADGDHDADDEQDR